MPISLLHFSRQFHYNFSCLKARSVRRPKPSREKGQHENGATTRKLGYLDLQGTKVPCWCPLGLGYGQPQPHCIAARDLVRIGYEGTITPIHRLARVYPEIHPPSVKQGGLVVAGRLLKIVFPYQ